MGKVKFFFLGNLNENNKEKLLKLKSIQDFDCEFFNIDEKILKNIRLSHSWNCAILYRLLIPEILSANIDKVIYLDSDLIVNADISNLWNLDIKHYLIGAALDYPYTNNPPKYFNSGVMILDLKKLRAFDFSVKWKKHASAIVKKLSFPDQDILNAVLQNNVFVIPQNWNVMGWAFYGNPKIDKYIVHYSGYKPWKPFFYNSSLKYLYSKYAAMTDFKEHLEFSRYDKIKFLLKAILIYWFIHPIFFFKPKFWTRVKKAGFIKTIC